MKTNVGAVIALCESIIFCRRNGIKCNFKHQISSLPCEDSIKLYLSHLSDRPAGAARADVRAMLRNLNPSSLFNICSGYDEWQDLIAELKSRKPLDLKGKTSVRDVICFVERVIDDRHYDCWDRGYENALESLRCEAQIKDYLARFSSSSRIDEDSAIANVSVMLKGLDPSSLCNIYSPYGGWETLIAELQYKVKRKQSDNIVDYKPSYRVNLKVSDLCGAGSVYGGWDNLIAEPQYSQSDSINVDPKPLDSVIVDPKQEAGSKKLAFDTVPLSALVNLAAGCGNGAAKYGKMNWLEAGKKLKASTYLNAVLRHYILYLAGQDNAEDSGICHLDHIICGLSVMRDAEINGNLVDDRTKLSEKGLKYLLEAINGTLS